MKITYRDTTAKRLDIFVTEHLTEVSRAFIGKLCAQGKILVNNTPERTGYKLKKDDTITIDYDFAEAQKIPEIELPILYEDDDCIVVNKPIGVLTHSKGAFNPEATVATFIASKLKGLEGERAGIVHRLDRATSGVIICAKTPEALYWLQKQFSQRKTKKQYIAVVEGALRPDEAIIDMPIERDPTHPKQFRVGKGGKPAKTAYKTLEANSQFSMLELKPVTGRTHQLRVHLKQLHHPIVGDDLYKGRPYERLMLHAKSLEITLPSRERKVFSAPLPNQFKAIMK